MNSFRVFVSLVVLILLPVTCFAQKPKTLVQKVGNFVFELRIPDEGLFAEEEVDLHFRITNSSKEDPIQGSLPVLLAKTTGKLSMPSMPGMPNQTPKTHVEGTPGEYGAICYFAHGGEFLLELAATVKPGATIRASFKLDVKDTVPRANRKPVPSPYTLEVASNPSTPKAGEPAELTIVVRERSTRRTVTEYEIVHEQLMHFLIASRDLSQFAHEHPEQEKGGVFKLRYVFPTGGEYRLFADVAPKGAGSRVVMTPIKVAGPPPPNVAVSTAGEKSVQLDGMRATVSGDPAKMPVGKSFDLKFALERLGGGPVLDLQPWLGAMAHLIMIHQDGATFVHSHPDELEPTNGKNGTIAFLARFPKPGLYRGWLQFMRNGKVQTASFVFSAKDKL